MQRTTIETWLRVPVVVDVECTKTLDYIDTMYPERVECIDDVRILDIQISDNINYNEIDTDNIYEELYYD